MKIVFVGTGVESLAIEFLSSYIKKHHHQVKLVFDSELFANEVFQSSSLANFFDLKKQVAQQVINHRPDLVAFSVFTFGYQRSLQIAGLIKKLSPQTPIIFGGIHPTSVPELVIKQKQVDIVCVGEGEQALVELLDSYQAKKQNTNIKNLWFKKGKKIIKNPCRPLIANLDQLPLPDKKLYAQVYSGFMNDYYTTSSRGCPYACTYCGNNVLRKRQRGLGPPVRRRSPQNLIQELILAKKNFSPKRITFVDDVFVQDLNWLKQFARLYQKHIKLPYAMLTHPHFVTKPIAKLLADSGCYFLLFGIQSASEKIRRQILHRYETNQDIKNAAKYCHQAGLKFSIDHIFNIPTETVTDYVYALKFYRQLKPSVINAYWLQYFPKTDIIKIALKQKILKPSDVKKINQGKTNTSLVVGIGGTDSFNPELVFKNFQFLFMILPILPNWLYRYIISKKLYLKKFQPPLFINILTKALVTSLRTPFNLYVYSSIIKQTLYFIIQNIKQKFTHV